MRKIIFFGFIVLALSSCRILNPSLMFKTPKGYKYAQMNDSNARQEYKISANDVIEFKLYANDGFKLTDVTGSNTATTTQMGGMGQTIITYPIDIEGNAKLPVLGKTMLKGMTLREAEKMLEEKYSLYYVRPFVMLKVNSKRALVFPGMGGAGRVIPLDYNNTTLLEGLAIAGGISLDGKAYEIKLIRRKADKAEVYHIDLSTIDGINQGNIILQANDIIYVEPRLKISQGILNELAPVLSLFSSLLLIYTTIKITKQ